MKVGDEVYLRDDPTVKGRVEFIGVSCVVVHWPNGNTGCYTRKELILASEYEKENMKPAGHPNASILMEIAKEAAINPEYWSEFEFEDDHIGWTGAQGQGELFRVVIGTDYNIRRKPRTIRIGNYDVPEPMRDIYEGSTVYAANVSAGEIEKLIYSNGFPRHVSLMSGGLLQKTKEGAELMLKALQELLAGK